MFKIIVVSFVMLVGLIIGVTIGATFDFQVNHNSVCLIIQ